MEQISKNPYRILGVFSNASLRGITANKFLLLLILFLTIGFCNAQTDSLYQTLQQKIEVLEQTTHDLKKEVSELNQQMRKLQSKSTEVDVKINDQQNALNNISNDVNANAENLANTSSTLDERITLSDAKSDGVAQNLKGRTTWGVVIILVLLLTMVLVYLLLRKRISKGSTAIEEIERTQKRLQEESIDLDNKLMELLEGQMKMGENKQAANTPNHALALKVADEITRIEINLSRMDPSIKGYKQLAASLKRIKDNFMANGYELVDMLGKPYTEGMRVNADFVINEELEDGKRIITGITKPQVNYKGEMIQKASITVSQNI